MALPSDDAAIEADIETIKVSASQGSNFARAVLAFYDKCKAEPAAVELLVALRIAYRDWKTKGQSIR